MLGQPKPDINDLLLQNHALLLDSIKEKKKAILNLDEPATISTTGKKLYLTTEADYRDVSTSAMRFKGHPGFGVRLIKIAASVVFAKKYSHLLDNAIWIPSDSWCYWFLHSVMNFSYRRITGKGRTAGPMTEKQQELWDKLLDTLALDFMQGVRPDMLIGSDEFGQFFFPTHEYIWDEKGIQHVECSIWDDKRQYTGNLIHNAMSELVTIQLIFGGKTARSLPAITPETEYAKDWILGYSENHWSNLTEKKRFIDWLAEWRNKRVAALIQERLLPASRKDTEPMVILLDCWSVNTCKEFRNWVKDKYPYMRLRFIPAGLTGKFQINDTYFHGPYKQWVRNEAEKWYQEQFTTMIERVDHGDLQLTELDDEIKKLMGLANLRNLSIKWNRTAMQKLAAVINDQGESLISKG